MNSVVGMVLIGVGLAFDLLGCIGLVRMPDLYNRLHAAMKCVTVGTILILVGTMVFVGMSALGVKALICAVFILLTSPAAAHAIARGAHISGVKMCDESVVDQYAEDRKADAGRKEAP